MNRMRYLFAFLSASVLTSSIQAAPKEEDWNKVVDKSIEYLKATQNADGSWGQAPRNRGMTGVIVTGLLQTGKVGPDDVPVAKALKFIESLVNPKAGHIAGTDAAVG